MCSEEKRRKKSRSGAGSAGRIVLGGALLLGLVFLMAACGTSRKLSYIKGKKASDFLFISKNDGGFVPEVDSGNKRDTIRVTDIDGQQVLVMKAVKDADSGEMVASDVLDAAVVTAKFRNVAERNGKVDIAFLVRIPPALQDSKWQLRLQPEMYMLGDTLNLDQIYITGNGCTRRE